MAAASQIARPRPTHGLELSAARRRTPPALHAHCNAAGLGAQFVADGVFYAELNELLNRELAEDGYSGVEVRVTPMRTEIIIRATRTQNVLGERRTAAPGPAAAGVGVGSAARRGPGGGGTWDHGRCVCVWAQRCVTLYAGVRRPGAGWWVRRIEGGVAWQAQ